MKRPSVTLSLAAAFFALSCGSDSGDAERGGSPTPARATPLPTMPGDASPTPAPVESPEGGPPIALAHAGASLVRSEDGGFTWDLALPVSAKPFLLDRFVGWATLGAHLFQTEDGGRSWASRGRPLDAASTGLEAVTFADRQRGVAVGYPIEEISSPVVAATTDGGESWSAATLAVEPDDEPFLTFPSPSVCVTRAGFGVLTWRSCCGASGRTFVALTRDFGAHWENVTDRAGVSSDRAVHGVGCAAERDLWLIEGEPLPLGGSPREGRLLRSTDGGESFAPVTQPSLDGAEVVIDGAHFLDGRLGWVVATTSAGVAVFRSTDGGESWELQLRDDERTAGRAVHFADAQHGIVSFDSYRPPFPSNALPVLLVTEDGGATWRRVELDPADASFGPVTEPWIRSEPAVRPTPPRPPTGAPSALLTARETGVLRSEDGGFRWEESFPFDLGTAGSPGSLLWGVTLVDGGRGWTVGDDGIVLKTEDGGRTWSSQTQNVALPHTRGVSWREIAFADRERGAMGGGLFYSFPGEVTREPVLVYTDDGGASWRPAEVRGLDIEEGLDPRVPRRICFTDDGRGLAADAFSFSFYYGGVVDGFRGQLVLLSEDAGATWRNIEPQLALPASFLIWDVACAGSSDLWIVGGLHTLPSDAALPYALHSSDGGASWETIDVPLPPVLGVGRSLSGVDFVDPALGWIAAPPVEDHLAILRTTDGGATWESRIVSDRPVFVGALVRFADERHGIVAASQAVGLLNRQPIVLVTDDGGATWFTVELGREPPSRAFLDLAVAR